MAKLKVHLSIGFPSATRSETIDIDDDELADCTSAEEREKLIDQYATEWAWNYIDLGAEIIE